MGVVLTGAIGAACTTPATSRPPVTQIYVSNEASGQVTVLDPVTDEIVDTIRVGRRPRGLRVAPDGRRLYVALSGSPAAVPGADPGSLPRADRAADGLGVVDLTPGAQGPARVGVIPAGRDPEAFDFSRDGAWVIVANMEAAEASLVDVRTGVLVAAVPVGAEPEGVTVHPEGRFAYVTSAGEDRVDVVDLRAREVVAQILTAARPRAVAFTPDGSLAVVTAELGAAVTLIDAREHTVLGDVAVPPVHGERARPMGVVITPDGATAWISCGRAGSVVELDLAARRIVRAVEDVGARPWGLALSPDASKLYTANGPSDDVTVIDVATASISRKLPAGGSPWGLAAPGGDHGAP